MLPAGVVDAQLLVDGVVYPAYYDPQTGRLTPLNPLPEGTHAIAYRYMDQAGNLGALSPAMQVTVDVTVSTPLQALDLIR